MKITKGGLLALLRRFHIQEHHFADMGPCAGLESVTLQGHVPLHQFNELFEVLAHTDTAPSVGTTARRHDPSR